MKIGFFEDHTSIDTPLVNQESVVGSVIQATGTVEFEDGLRTGVLEDGSPPWRLLVPLWRPHLAQDQFCTTRGVQVGHGSSVVVKKDPCQTKFQFC